MEKALSKRWEFAQLAEKVFWKGYNTELILKECKERDEKKAEFFTPLFAKYLKLSKSTKVLQVGAGPHDIINSLKFGKRYSIDPLADFYKSKFDINYKETNLVNGVGEDLPFEDNFFDIVIISNVLDHTDKPKQVLEEAHRVLKKGGIILIECYFYQKLFLFLSKIYSIFHRLFKKKLFNAPHPHMFYFNQLQNIISKKFIVLEDSIAKNLGLSVESVSDIRRKKLKEKFSRKIPALFGLVGAITYSAIAKK